MSKTVLDINIPKFFQPHVRAEWFLANNKQNLEILKEFRFSKDFFVKESNLFNTFYDKLSKSDFFEHLNNFDDNNNRSDAVNQLIDTFSDTYNLKTPPVVEYYNTDSYTKDYEEKYKSKCQNIPTMCADNNKLRINQDTIKGLGSKGFVESVYHECVHFYQSQGDFSKSPDVSKGFKELGQLNFDKSLYYYLPVERHAYSMQHIFSYKLSNENKLINKTERQKTKTESVYEAEENLYNYIYGHSFSLGLDINDEKAKNWQNESLPNAIADYKSKAISQETNVDFAYDKIFSNSVVNYDNKTRSIHFETTNHQALSDMFGKNNVKNIGGNKYKTTPISNRQELHLKNGYARHKSRLLNQVKTY